MKKFLKILSIILVALFAILLIVPSLLSGKISDIVKREANTMLNAKVEFAELNISLLRHFPKASLSLIDFSVIGVDEFEGQTLVAGERIDVAVDIFSIFGESFEVSKVWLLSPEIHGVIAKNGEANWDIMKESGEAEVVAEEQSSEPSSFSLSLKQLAIENAKVYYTDNTSAMHFHTAPPNCDYFSIMIEVQRIISPARPGCQGCPCFF